jgi:thioredoxin 1
LLQQEMNMAEPYQLAQPELAAIEAMPGVTALEFGTHWCGYCRAAEPHIAAALADHPQVRHLKVEDGKGRPLGRAFWVKLWPTVVVLRDGREVARVVRPQDVQAVRTALAAALCVPQVCAAPPCLVYIVAR